MASTAFNPPPSAITSADIDAMPVTWFGWIAGVGYCMERLNDFHEIVGNLGVNARDPYEQWDAQEKEFHSED